MIFFMKISDKEAIRKILNGEIVALPTDTLFGLSAQYSDTNSINNIFTLKDRPKSSPLIILLPDIHSLSTLTDHLSEEALRLAYAFWPGPLTMILPANIEKIPSIVRANKDTCAFRIPANKQLLSILYETGPLVAPSANLSGKIPATQYSHVEDDFGLEFPVVEQNEPQTGIESTILNFHNSKWHIQRSGAICVNEFEPILGYLPTVIQKDDPIFSNFSFEVFDEEAINVTSIIGFSDRSYPKNAKFFSLGDSTLPEKACKNLYTLLRKLEKAQILRAHIDMNFPKSDEYLLLFSQLNKIIEKKILSTPLITS